MPLCCHTMELTYRTEGDYRLPNLTVPETPKVGKYGMLRRSYLQKHRNSRYKLKTAVAISRRGISAISLVATPRMARVSKVLKS